MNENQQQAFLDFAIVNDLEVPAWKNLDTVVRKWAILSQFEQEQENYEKLKSQNDDK